MPLMTDNSYHNGVALLYAVLLVSIVLTVSLSLLNITYKQIILTWVSRESQVAHFNAWSAVECIKRANNSFKNASGNDLDTNPFGVFSPSSLIPTSPANSSGPSPVYTCSSDPFGKIDVIVETPSGLVVPVGNFGASGIFSRYKLTGTGLIGGCAFADVVKVSVGNYDNFPGEASSELDAGHIMITGLGYNTSQFCANPGQISLRLIERRIRVKVPG